MLLLHPPFNVILMSLPQYLEYKQEGFTILVRGNVFEDEQSCRLITVLIQQFFMVVGESLHAWGSAICTGVFARELV